MVLASPFQTSSIIAIALLDISDGHSPVCAEVARARAGDGVLILVLGHVSGGGIINI